MDNQEACRAVRFDHYGGVEVLQVVDVEQPSPGKGEVLVHVIAAGINPGESAIREGKLDKMYPATFPSGEGSDLAGIVQSVGKEVTKFSEGDEVIGFTDNRASHADYVVVEEDHLTKKPLHVPWDQAGSLFVVGTTAYAAIRAVRLKAGETLVVSAAAGGVGSVVVQLARNLGANVIGLAGPGSHEWLKSHGVIPMDYHGADLAARILKAAGGKVHAFIDTHGDGYVALAVEMGVSSSRIDTIIDFEAAKQYGVQTKGNGDAAKASVLSELAVMIEAGRLEIPIAGAYPLEKVQDAYKDLEQRHTHGKIVLVLAS